jgi:transposase
MSRRSTVRAVTTIGIDMGKNTLHMVGLDSLGAVVLRERVSRGRITSRLANLPPCLIGIEAGMATHYVARELCGAWPRREAGSAGICEAVSAGTQE